MTVYKVYEAIKINLNGEKIPDVNTWLATFRSKEKAEEYLVAMRRNDYTSTELMKRHFMTTEEI